MSTQKLRNLEILATINACQDIAHTYRFIDFLSSNDDKQLLNVNSFQIKLHILKTYKTLLLD